MEFVADDEREDEGDVVAAEIIVVAGAVLAVVTPTDEEEEEARLPFFVSFWWIFLRAVSRFCLRHLARRFLNQTCLVTKQNKFKIC